MKFDFESLSAEPLFYMLMHSGAFVSVLGGVFFIIGLLFGYATWGRYKRQTRELKGEAEAMKDEIAQLKRKIGDQSVKSGQAIAIATETIQMPAKEGTKAAVPAAASPAPEAPAVDTAEANRPSTKNRLPKPRLNTIKAKAPAMPEAAVTPPPAAVKPETSAAPVQAAAPAKPITTSIPLPPPTEAPPPPAPARHASPLAAIIATAPPEKKEGEEAEAPAPTGLVPVDTIPTMTTEMPAAPVTASVIQPVLDPRLGLIYKSKPEKIDDLTALKGIAQVLEQRLHEMGVYTHAQIAAWSEDQIKEFSSRLAFKDRIQRERWVEQAQQLLQKQNNVEEA